MGNWAKWEEEVVRRKVRWAGHIWRRGEERRTKRIMAGEEERGRRRQGRPKRRWEDTMKEYVGYDWKEKANNREEWRRLVQQAGEKVEAILK